MSIESQRSIADWADQTFGPCTAPTHAIQRATEEMAEFMAIFYDLMVANKMDGWEHKALNEAADVVITLYRLAHVLGADLGAEVDRKMAINRQRRWKADGTGHGQHLPDPDPDPDPVSSIQHVPV